MAKKSTKKETLGQGIGWFSGGATSAVSIKLALDEGYRLQIYYFETGQHHEDSTRFLSDCEKWFGQTIHVMRNKKAWSVEKVLEKGYINSPGGASCTKFLKKDVRIALEKFIEYDFQIFGFEYEKRQIIRAERFVEQYPESKGMFPLIKNKLTKPDCFEILKKAKIKLPAMYGLGYSNANCIGCVKGGKKYWSKISQDFPEIFKRTGELERAAGHSCINGTFLDELDVNKYIKSPEKIELPECGVVCEVEMMGEDS